MNDTVLIALIGVAGVAVGAVFTFLASYFTAKQKIKELELLYQQKLDETERAYRQQLDKVYYENARDHLETLYLPLNVSLAKLEDEHDKFRKVLSDIYQGRFAPIPDQEQLNHIVQNAVREYEQSCANYNQKVAKLLKQNAHLTSQFESYLRTFNHFIQDSLPLSWNITRLFITQGIYSKPIYTRKKHFKFLRRTTEQFVQVHSNRETRDFNVPFEEVVIPAVIISDLYDTRFKYGIGELKALIKELTLGVKPERQNYLYENVIDKTTT